MCGIVGFWDNKTNSDRRAPVALLMAEQIKSRGPDDFGTWEDKSSGFICAHRRLSILELSSAGHQPMISPCGRYCLVFNGEIYNHLDLREELEKRGGGVNWRGHSDTETLLACVRHWGLEGTLSKLNGMFAFAVWDNKEKRLFLARDRMGEKPVYYGLVNNVFFFGSELKALKIHPLWKGEIDRDALGLYMRHNYIPGPYCIYKNIKKLPAASYVVISDQGRSQQGPRFYWDLHEIAKSSFEHEANKTYKEYEDELDFLLKDSVKKRMLSDVPLGVFLSGGFDSTIVASMMQSLSSTPIKTFSIGFNEKGYNEAEYAKKVSEHLKTEHTELYVSSKDAMSAIPLMSKIYDEPFSDSSQIPTYIVSQLASKDVKVCLTGDGGDELFCGYKRYFLSQKLWSKVALLPKPFRQLLSQLLLSAPIKIVAKYLDYVVPGKWNERVPRLGEILSSNDRTEFYRGIVSHSKNTEKLVHNSMDLPSIFTAKGAIPQFNRFEEEMMYIDMLTYLVDDILVKVDRASMAVSLESRVPLLDHRLVEFAWRLPFEFKYKSGKGKWILRNVLDRYVPRNLMERPKMGFGVPIGDWLKADLRDWAEDLLSEKKLKSQGYFDHLHIRNIWSEHVNGERNGQYYLWDVLMFQAWLEDMN